MRHTKAKPGHKRQTGAHGAIRQTLDKNLSQHLVIGMKCEKMMLSTANKSSINIDATILRSFFPDRLDVGKSYWKYLKESGDDPKSTTLIVLLEMYLYYRASKTGTAITGNDQLDIIDICESLRQKSPAFDSTSAEGIIYGLVLTADWRRSLEILDSIQISSKPSSDSAVIQRALQEQDEHLVWKLIENIDKMLTFHKFIYNCSTATVSKQGTCQSCRKRLRDIDITDDEFKNLSNHFFDKIFIEENIFNKSTPGELKSFIAFLMKQDRTTVSLMG